MAQTLANGFVVPQRTDPISESGVDEMRLLGASGDARVGQLDLQSRTRDADLADQIAGMEGMTYVGAWESDREYRINDVVTHGGDSWARLTAGSDGEPGADSTAWGLVARKGDGGGFGELTETSVPGLWEGVGVGIELGDSHLDTIIAPNTYVCRSSENALKALGYPYEGVPGTLVVLPWNPVIPRVIAVFYPWTSRAVVKRTLNGDGTWREWMDLHGNPIESGSSLADRLASIEYASGERDLTTLAGGITSGSLLVERTGHTVQMTFNDVQVEDQGSSYTAWGGLLPTGWRPTSTIGYRYLPLSPTSGSHSNGPMRVSRYGDVGVYNSDGGRTIRGTVTWTTTDPVPTTPLGDSA